MLDHVLTITAKILCGATPRWVDCEPSTQQRIYYANHTSNLDLVVLWTALPPELRRVTRPAAAHDYWTANRLRYFTATKVFNAVLIERKKVTVRNNPLDLMLEAIGTTHSLVIFPEGRRNPGPDVGEFKSGLYHLSKKRPDIDLVPVYIDNANRVLPRGEILPVPILSCISFGPPLRVTPEESKPDFLKRAREAILALKET